MAKKKKKSGVYDKDKVMRVRSSRKVYLPFYALAAILTIVALFIFFSGRDLSTLSIVLIVIFLIVIVKVTEIHRLMNLWEVNPETMVHTRGILNKVVENLDFLAVSHIEIDQNFWKRLLNYGDVNVRVFGRENTTPVKNIGNPAVFVRFFEDRVNEKRIQGGR